MIVRLFSIIAPVFACAAFGYAWARFRRPFDTAFVTRLIMNVGAPCLILSSFAGAGGNLDRTALTSVGLAMLLVLAMTGGVAAIVIRALGLEVRSYMNSVTFHNSGNMGLPLCLFAFGREGLSLGIIVFLVVSTMHFTVGTTIVSGERHPGRILRMPLVWASALAVTMVLTGWKLPQWIADTVGIMGGLAIPLMLLSLGVQLATLRVETVGRSLLFSLFRYGFGIGAGLLAARIVGLEGTARGVLVLQTAMPAAVFNYLMAERYQRSPQDVAGIVVTSTVLSFAVIPAVLWFLLR
jgi:predicted permease